MKITEIQITPVKPHNGVCAFCSFVFEDSFYMGSIALIHRPDGSYRLSYPAKRIGENNLNIYHPINKECGEKVLRLIENHYEQLMKGGCNGRSI